MLTSWRRDAGGSPKHTGLKAITALTKKAFATSEEGGARTRRNDTQLSRPFCERTTYGFIARTPRPGL